MKFDKLDSTFYASVKIARELGVPVSQVKNILSGTSFGATMAPLFDLSVELGALIINPDKSVSTPKPNCSGCVLETVISPLGSADPEISNLKSILEYWKRDIVSREKVEDPMMERELYYLKGRGDWKIKTHGNLTPEVFAYWRQHRNTHGTILPCRSEH